MKRLFTAIKVNPSDQFLDIYSELRLMLRSEKITWVNENKIHLTLKFFGDTHEDRIDDICDILDQVSLRHKTFETELKNIGIFGSSYKPRVIWFGLEKTKAVIALAEDVLNSLEETGFERDRQNFRPHLTVGRIKFIRDKGSFQETLDAFKNTCIQRIPVEEFHLIESRLRPEGPEYETIETFRLV